MEHPASISLSVVIVNFNSGVDVLRCLHSLGVSGRTVQDLVVIVVDNASTDSSVSSICSKFPAVKLMHNGENKGFAAGANQGAAHSRREYIMFLNPDTDLDPDFFTGLTGFLRKYPGASIVGCRMVDKAGRQQGSCWKTPTWGSALIEAILPYAISKLLSTQKPRTAREVDAVSGACMVVSRDAFEALGGFDERFFMYYEDADLCLRARQAGLRVMYCPDASGFHRVGGSAWANPLAFALANFTSKLRYFKKHYSPTYFGAVKWIVAAGIVIRVPVYLLAGVLSIDKRLIHLAVIHLKVLPKALRV